MSRVFAWDRRRPAETLKAQAELGAGQEIHVPGPLREQRGSTGKAGLATRSRATPWRCGRPTVVYSIGRYFNRTTATATQSSTGYRSRSDADYRHLWCAVGLAIPCPVARLQSRTPLHQAKGLSVVRPGRINESSFAQLRHQGRAEVLRRRARYAMKFLGVQGNLHSLRPGRAGDRPSVDVWCNPHVGLTPGYRTNRLHPLAERQAATSLEKTGLFSHRPGCALLTFETM